MACNRSADFVGVGADCVVGAGVGTGEDDALRAVDDDLRFPEEYGLELVVRLRSGDDGDGEDDDVRPSNPRYQVPSLGVRSEVKR